MAAAWDRREPAEQARVEELGLADWLPGAATFAPHWSDLVGRLGIDPDDLVTRHDLERLPPVLQGDVAGAGGARLVQRPTESQVKAVAPGSLLLRIARGIGQDNRDGKRDVLLREFKPVHVTRGGAAGQLAIASSRADLDRLHRVGARLASLVGLGDHDYLVSAVPAGPSAAYWTIHTTALGSSMLALHPRGHGDGLERCIEAFQLLPATAVACPADEAAAWAAALAEADADVSRVVTVLLVGPPPDDDTREAVRAAWRDAGAREHELAVRAVWGPDEHRVAWAECAAGTEGLHTMPDLEVLEVVDGRTGEPTEGAGELVVTSLGWSGTTLLRYRTGAHVEGLTTEPCPACRRTVPRVLGPVTPRAWQPELTRPEGLATLDLRALALELDDAGLHAWRVELQRGEDGEGYALELGGDVPDERARQVAASVRRAVGIAPAAIRLTEDADAVEGRNRLEGAPWADHR